MCTWNRAAALAALAPLFLIALPAGAGGTAGLAGAGGEGPGRFPGVGRPATPAEVKAWDIDVRKDFAGLPKGSGSVERGQQIWDAQCASCHGTFGESNEVFNPIVGGTTPEDVRSGVVRSLTTSQLQRTTMMKLSSLATLWDYIRRAMPWNAPKSLPVDDVYAVSAYILHLADLVPTTFVLSDANIRDTDKLLPNRNGLTSAHGLWNVGGKPDVRNTACMRNCEADLKVHSSIPEYARNAHGNLALQNRGIGGVRGIDTTVAGAPEVTLIAGANRPGGAAAAEGSVAGAPAALATQQGCLACHGVDRKVVGPGFREIAARYRGDGAGDKIVAKLAGRIRGGTAGAWGSVPMPAQAQLSEANAELLARWIAAGAPPQ